jgi:hypothetical protein
MPAADRITTLALGGESHAVRADPSINEPSQWLARESDGAWQWRGEALTGEWLRNSPSLFYRRRITTPYLWQVRVTRLKPDADFERRFAGNKHAQGATPEQFYNFNFWLRADSPDGGDFLEQYPAHLGTGWNGMGDEHWRSLYCTVVHQPARNWCRLRHSPGYRLAEDTTDRVPFCAYDVPHTFHFIVTNDRVRAFCDDQPIFDHRDATIPTQGYIGLCVWLCRARFDEMRLYELV